MSEFVHKPGSFSLFKNTKKGDNEKAPDYRGPGKDLDGNDIEVAAWLKDGGKGKFMSCTFKPAGERKEPAQSKRPPDDSDDIPF